MENKTMYLECECGKEVAVSDNQHFVTCPVCRREYKHQMPKLKFMGIEEESYPAVIIC